MPESDVRLEELRTLVRSPVLLGQDAEAHEQPWRGIAGAALAVVRPDHVEEVRSIIRWGRRHRVRLLPQGANTGLVGASTPPPDGPPPVIVSTDLLRAPTEIDPVGATATVGSGVRLSTLNELASQHGLELPIDLSADPTIGAMVATNTAGSRVLRHGHMARHILDCEAVIADADASVIGGRVALRKNNTGPRTTQFLVGSAGAFAIITSVTVSLAALPEIRCTALVGPVDDGIALDLLMHVRRRLGDRLSAFEVMSSAAMGAALHHMAEPLAIDAGHDPDVVVLVEASGDSATQDRLVDAIGDAPGVDPQLAVLVPAGDAWRARHCITAALAAHGSVIGFDLSVAIRDLPALRDGVRELVRSTNPGLRLIDFGHWGDGGMHANVLVPDSVRLSTEDVASLRDDVYKLAVERFAGSFSAEHGIGPANAEWWLRTTPAAEVAALSALKNSLDPLHVLGHPGIPFA